MNCRDLQEGGLLDALEPGRSGTDRWAPVPDEIRAAAEKHLTECAACREARDTLLRLRRAVAGLPAETEPPRDLWPGIAARLSGEGKPERAPTRGRRVLRGGLLAAAAAALALFVIAPAWRGGGGASVGTGTGTADLVSLQVRNSGYEKAERELWSVYDARRDAMAATTVADLERNIQIVDRALADARAALERDPANLAVSEVYRRVQKKKLDLLRAAARASNLT